MADGFLIDLHCHTRERSFDGRVPAVDIVRQIAEVGFQGVIFTDHATVWPPEALEELRAESGLGPEFLLWSGQEVRARVEMRGAGDLLVYGPGGNIADGTAAEEVFRRTESAGGFCIAAHPAVPRIGFGPYAGDYPVTALEVWNGRYGPKAAAAAEELAAHLGLPGVGGSDTHRPEDIAGGGTLLPRRPESFADLKLMIACGEAKPWKPKAPKRVLDWLFRSELD